MIKKIDVIQNYILEFVERAISHNMIILEVFDDLFSAGSYVDGIRVNGYNLELDFKDDTPSELLEKDYICYDTSFPDMGRQYGKRQVMILKIKETKNKEKDMKKIDILDELERVEKSARKDGMKEDRMLHYGSLTYVYIDHRTPFFNIGVNIRGAGGLEYKSGVAHFTEHMLSANPSEVEIFNKNSIFNNASTSIVDTRYYLDHAGALLTNIPRSNDDDVEKLYKNLAKEITSYIDEFFYWWKLIKKYSLKNITDEELEILTKEFERHRSVIREEINMKNKKLDRDLTKQLRYYSNVEIPEWYDSVLGTEEDLDNITLDDIAEFYSKYYKMNSVLIAFNIPHSVVLEYPELYKKYLEPKIKNLKAELLVDGKLMVNNKKSTYFVNFKEDYENNSDIMEIEYAEHSKVNFLMKLPDTKSIAEEFGVPTRFVHELSITLENAIYDQVTSKLRQDGLIYGLTFWRNRNIGFNTGRSKLLLMCFTNNHEDTITATLDTLNNLKMTIDNIITDERSVLKNVSEYTLNQSYMQFNETVDRKDFDKYFKGVNYPDYFYETFYILNDGVNGKYDMSNYEKLIKIYLEEFKSKLKDIHILKCIPKSDK